MSELAGRSEETGSASRLPGLLSIFAETLSRLAMESFRPFPPKSVAGHRLSIALRQEFPLLQILSRPLGVLGRMTVETSPPAGLTLDCSRRTALTSGKFCGFVWLKSGNCHVIKPPLP